MTVPESSSVDLLLCPSDQARGRTFTSTAVWVNNKIFAKGNYAAYVGPEHAECMVRAKGAMINEIQPLSHVTDGTSNTLMISEVRTREDVRDARGAWALAWQGASMLAADVHSGTVQTRICGQPSPAPYVPNPIWSEFVLTPNIQTYEDDIYLCTTFVAAEARLDKMPCKNQSSSETIAAARSNHTGGVNGAHIDGSVRWINDDIEPVIYGTLICINDGTALKE